MATFLLVALLVVLYLCICYVFSLCGHPIMFKFFYHVRSGIHFNGLSTALSDKNELIYSLIRFDKILTL